MSGATPTLLPRTPIFPLLLPKAPQPHPIPLPKRRVYAHINAFRDLQREMDDLSDEENELEDLNMSVRNRGFGFLVPIGRSLTRQEEKNDAEEDTDESTSAPSGAAQSVMEDDGENDSALDLDASMEDLDEDATAETEDNDDMNEGDTEDFEEEPSDII